MPLPFDLSHADTQGFAHPGVPAFALPRYESVTPAEELAIIPSLKATAEALDQESLVRCQVSLATLALQRLHPDQTDADTAALPLPLVKELADFLLNERRGWEPVEEEETSPKSTGANTKSSSRKSSPNSTGDSQPVGPSDSAANDSPKSPSRKSARQASLI